MLENYSVFGVGNPLMDIISPVSPSHLRRMGAVPGAMELIDGGRAGQINSEIDACSRYPGGSCANTLRGVAWLTNRGLDSHRLKKPVMNGMVGDDRLGHLLISSLSDAGVVSRLSLHPKEPTGTSLVLVTPDGQRTMFTSLGASQKLRPGDIDREALDRSTFFYATAYLWGLAGLQEALFVASSEARKKGILVAFDIADPFIANRFGRELKDWISNSVDLLFANEDEARMLATIIDGEPAIGAPEVACASVATLAPTVVVKVGADGCVVWQYGKLLLSAPGVPARVLDTTGAGDSFSAGFLFAMLAGGSPKEAASLANRLGAAIVEVEGCNYDEISLGFSL